MDSQFSHIVISMAYTVTSTLTCGTFQVYKRAKSFFVEGPVTNNKFVLSLGLNRNSQLLAPSVKNASAEAVSRLWLL